MTSRLLPGKAKPFRNQSLHLRNHIDGTPSIFTPPNILSNVVTTSPYQSPLSPMAFLRLATIAARPAVRASALRLAPRALPASMSMGVRAYSDAHAEETFEEFTAR